MLLYTPVILLWSLGATAGRTGDVVVRSFDGVQVRLAHPMRVVVPAHPAASPRPPADGRAE